jgi:tetratricopeptide (TPR) repeat protein
MTRLFFQIIFLVIIVNCVAQNSNSLQKKSESLYNEAKNYAQSGDRVKAINLLNQVLKNNPHYYMAFFGLADIYHETGERQLEREALINGLQTGSERFPKGYRFLAELLYADADYSEALKNMENYYRLKNPLTIEENHLLESCRFAVKAVGSPVDYLPENAGEAINTNEDEYWPSLNGEANTLVFTRLVSMDKDGRKLAYPQEDFYVSHKYSAGWQKAVPLGPPVNTGENEGAQCISAD